jgi:CheY-like chemotaxis protein
MSPLSIILVEDDISTRSLLAELLQVHGYDVLETADGAQALRLLEIVAPPCVMILDLILPKVDGWELLRQLAADPRLSRMPVVVLTASGAPAPPGVRRFLRKPVDGIQLLEIVRSICGEAPAA